MKDEYDIDVLYEYQLEYSRTKVTYLHKPTMLAVCCYLTENLSERDKKNIKMKAVGELCHVLRQQV